ncbi:hypothetical protein ETQ85_04805 [Zoogloea oleivorans]|uniref:Uncharacterized protein n=1 Tax=Zoogloea oleivorans TaxID=1552750 RepID=A0A6C2D419_9RHOO|nr:hypothetical protein [Zoogloea oleivorans]TYC60721.1 hypothetical protein ETQ85_04805 [Zoogloea oleivorans]
MALTDMTIDQIIALSASVGAFMSAIATFLTVRQMSHQRQASYLPELVLSRTIFKGTANPIAAGPIPSHWIPKARNESKTEVMPLFSLPLTNVGLGAAKDISVSWSFPIEKIVRQVNDLAQKTLTPLYFELEDGAVSIKSESLGGGTSFWKNQQKEMIDYVLPAAVQNEPVQLKIPHAFVLMVSALFFVSSKDAGKNSALDIPSLVVHLSFRDIGNKAHTAAFEISLQVIAYGGDGSFLHGYLESKKCA